MDVRTSAAIWSPSQATTQSDGSSLGIAGELDVGLLGLLGGAPMVAEDLDGRLPDRPRHLAVRRPDLEARRQRRVGEIGQVGSHHLGASPHDRVAGRLEECQAARIVVIGEREVIARPVGHLVGGDLAAPRLLPAEHRAADAVAPHGGIDKAERRVIARAVGVVAPFDAAVRDDPIVELADDHVAVAIAVGQAGVVVVHPRHGDPFEDA